MLPVAMRPLLKSGLRICFRRLKCAELVAECPFDFSDNVPEIPLLLFHRMNFRQQVRLLVFRLCQNQQRVLFRDPERPLVIPGLALVFEKSGTD